MPPAIVRFGTIPGLSPTQFTKLREQIDTLEGERIPAATSGAKLMFEDAPPFTTSDGRPVRLTYAVVTEAEVTKSDISNLAMVVPIDPGPAPSEVRAEARPEGVRLTWKAGEGRRRFNIYRTAKNELPDEFATPLNPAPIDTTTYDDAPAYGTYDYRVTTVASAGPPRVESGLSAAATVEFRDLVPPPPPASVTVLVETSRIARLIWDPVDAPDIRGYNVYRTEGKVRLKLTPHPAQQTFFGDESLQHGVTYFYTVTSVDRSGNESAPVKSENVMIPNTP
jgi:fibronectin type 3 domain-containing protein